MVGVYTQLYCVCQYGLARFFSCGTNSSVSASRSPGQKLVALALDEPLLNSIEQARGGISRSQFIRDAIAAKLEAEGIRLREDATAPPDRAGKGGRKVRYLTKKQADKKKP